MSVLNKGALFPKELEKELLNLVRGKSSLARLANQEPVPFVGKDIVTFNFDGDISVVAESGAKPAGSIVAAPVSMAPVKIVYQARVSDEFMRASEEKQLDMLSAFSDGFAKKMAAGFDKMALHGINPATGSASGVIGTNHFDAKVTSNVITYDNTKPDENINDAIELVETAGYDVTGCIISPDMRSAIAKLKNASNAIAYPDFAFGAVPGTMGPMTLEKNVTMGSDKALVGDFENLFRWGVAEEIPMEIIQFGDPDGAGTDLKAVNQVCLRCEAFIAWAIADPAGFAFVK